MRINTTHLLFAFALGIGLSIVFSFPAGSSGAVRLDGSGSKNPPSVGKINQQSNPGSVHLVIDTLTHSLMIHRDGGSPLKLRAQGAYSMKQGTFSISRKEVNPIWKAPPTYFLRRGLPLPPEGSRERGMRGALGEHAIFIDEGRAIHSGPVWSDDVGGIKISRDDMALLFDAVPVGATVEVR